jgi:ferrochelatase
VRRCDDRDGVVRVRRENGCKAAGDIVTMSAAVLLVSHGTVDRLDDLPAFVTNVRRGRPPPPALVAELSRRYEAIGGASPLNRITAEVARKLEAVIGVRVFWANRLWKPYVAERLAVLRDEGARRVGLVPLAQHSAAIYAADAAGAASELGLELRCARNWGQSARLCEAFVRRIAPVLAASPEPDKTALVVTAHSLPRSVVDAGDPYEREVRSAAQAIEAALRDRTNRDPRLVVSFQSQGMSEAAPGARPIEWLGPDLASTLDRIAAAGDRHVVVAPVGFLADHVETLYDLDIEARTMARDRGLSFARVPSLNADDDLIGVLAAVARPLVGDDG